MTSRRELVTLALVLGMLGAAPGAVSATTMVYASVEDLTEASTWVVDARVVDARVFEGEHGRTTTHWTLRVVEVVHGAPVEELVVEQWAGELDGIVSHIPGDVRITLGERAIFFLRGDDPQRLFFTAMGQSKYGLVGPGPGDVLPSLEARSLLFAPGALRGVVQTLIGVDPEVERTLDDIAFVQEEGGQAPLFHMHDPEVLRRSELLRRVRAVQGVGGSR